MIKFYFKLKNNPRFKRIWQNIHFRRYERWVLLIVWAGAIFFVSSRPLTAFLVQWDIWHLILRKLAHMFEFAVLCFLFFRVFKFTEKRHVYWDLFWAFVFSILYAISDEYHQTFIPGRHGAYKDVLIDSVGILIATWLLYIYYHFHPQSVAKNIVQEKNILKESE